jgi:formyltetrahydrofolate deformylase
MKKAKQPEYILTLSCPDRRGIVHAVAGLIADCGCTILDSAQYSDAASDTFFMRVHLADELGGGGALREKLMPVAKEFGFDWKLHDAVYRPRVLLMASKTGHCLNDLLFRYSSGLIHADVVAVISNHADFRALTEAHGIPYHWLRVDHANRAEQEMALLAFVEEQRIDLVVLARYMQVLSPGLCRALRGRAINNHHSFLPSIKGAHP